MKNFGDGSFFPVDQDGGLSLSVGAVCRMGDQETGVARPEGGLPPD